MEVRQSWIVFGLILAPIVLNPQEIQQTLDDSAEVRAQNAAFTKAESKARNLANQRLLESETALSRVEAACVPVVDSDSLKEVRMVEGEGVIVPDFPERTLGDETLICNSLGDTAEVWNGEIAYVASAAPADLPAYLELFEQQRK